jgi:transcription elongation factor Elf1
MTTQLVKKGGRVYCPYCQDSYDVDDYVDESTPSGKLMCATCGREFEFELITSSQDTPSKSISVNDAVNALVRIYENHPEGLYPDAPDRIKVREIGQSLYDAGGISYMLSAHQEFTHRNHRHARNLEMVWNGIGEWMG